MQNQYKNSFLLSQLPDNTIHIRPSMIKIKADSSSLGGKPFNSMEVVTTRYDKVLHLLDLLIAMM